MFNCTDCNAVIIVNQLFLLYCTIVVQHWKACLVKGIIGWFTAIISNQKQSKHNSIPGRWS